MGFQATTSITNQNTSIQEENKFLRTVLALMIDAKGSSVYMTEDLIEYAQRERLRMIIMKDETHNQFVFSTHRPLSAPASFSNIKPPSSSNTQDIDQMRKANGCDTYCGCECWEDGPNGTNGKRCTHAKFKEFSYPQPDGVTEFRCSHCGRTLFAEAPMKAQKQEPQPRQRKIHRKPGGRK